MSSCFYASVTKWAGVVCCMVALFHNLEGRPLIVDKFRDPNVAVMIRFSG